jgi:YD repeat-containing protein
VEGFAFDVGGNLVYQTNYNGMVITNQYDELNRLTNQISVNGYQVGYVYDPATGQRVRMTDASGVTAYGYDRRDRLVLKTVNWNQGPGVSLNYGYDANGNVTNLWSGTAGGVNLAYRYDPLNRLTNVAGQVSRLAEYAYDGVGNLQTAGYGNGVTNQYQYDVLNRLTNLTASSVSGTIARFYYQLGLTGNRTNLSETVNNAGRTYAWKYDALNRLTNETISALGSVGYGYDAVGNRTSRASVMLVPTLSAIILEINLMNVKTKLFAAIKMMGLLLALTGCAQLPVRASLEYYIGFMNKTGRDLGGVCVYYGEVEAAAKGALVKGGEATYGAITLPIPVEANMRWVENNQRHSVKVKLGGLVSKQLTDEWTIYFVINADGTVQAKAIKDNDETAMKELEKGLRPEGEYRVGIVNKTGRDLEDVSTYFGEKKVTGAKDILTRVKLDYSDPLLMPIPAEAEMRWNEEDGTPHAVKVKLDGIVPKDYAAGTIFFVIKPDNTVEAHPVKWGDDKEAAKVVK